MNEIICYDANGIVIEYLYQWDINQLLKISGLDVTSPILIHFSNSNMYNALVVKPTVLNKMVIVEIPNIMLMSGKSIQVYVYQDTDSNIDGEYDGAKTICAFTIPVKTRQKPDDYFYSDNVEYISVKKYIDDAIEATNKINNLIDSITSSIENGEFDGSTPEIGENGNWFIDGVDTGVSAQGISEDEIKEIINEYLKNNPIKIEVDQTLTQSGKAADAKTVGDMLGTKANKGTTLEDYGIEDGISESDYVIIECNIN